MVLPAVKSLHELLHNEAVLPHANLSFAGSPEVAAAAAAWRRASSRLRDVSEMVGGRDKSNRAATSSLLA